MFLESRMFDFGTFFFNKAVVEICNQTFRGESIGNHVNLKSFDFVVLY